MVTQLVGGLRSGMGYCEVSTIEDLQNKTRFVKITDASLRESHVHDVFITKEAPNYQLTNSHRDTKATEKTSVAFVSVVIDYPIVVRPARRKGSLLYFSASACAP
jgi:hypothetical protein